MIDRDLNHLEANFKFKVLRFLSDTRIKELGVFVTEGFRSAERQQQLYNQGRTTPGVIVTWTLKSNHCEGKAIDIAFVGKDLYPSDMRIWNEVYDIAEKYGINSLYKKYGVDKPHLEEGGTIIIPPVSYIDNQKTMNKELEAKMLEVLINGSSVCFNVTDNLELQKKLSEFANYLRSLKK